MNDQLLDVVSEPRADQVTSFSVTLKGELDAASAPRLHDELDALVDGGALLIVIDGSALHFLDSSGLRVLVVVADRLRRAGGALLIEGLSGAARRVLELTGLLEHYTRPST